MDFVLNFSDPTIAGYFVPLVVSMVFVSLIRFLLGDWRGDVYASVAILFGFLAMYVLVRGFDLWPVGSVLGALPWLILFGLPVGVILDEMDDPDFLRNVMLALVPFLTVFWIANLSFVDGASFSTFIVMALVILLAVIVLGQVHGEREAGLNAPISLMMVLGGMAMIGEIRNEAITPYAVSLAAATLGYLFWNWPRLRHPWGASGTFTLGTATVGIIAIMLMRGSLLEAVPIIIVLTSIFVPLLMEKLFPVNRFAAPFVQIMFSMITIILGGIAQSIFFA